MNPSAAQLRDIHLPNPVGWWPPAPGWWLLGTLLLLTLVLAGGYAIARWRRGRTKRQALTALASAADLQTINALLKRAALAYFDRSRVASLHGPGWFRFLDAQLPGGQALFTEHAELWQQLLYGRPATPQQLQQFRQLARRWLKRALPPVTSRPLYARWLSVMSFMKRRRSQGA